MSGGSDSAAILGIGCFSFVGKTSESFQPFRGRNESGTTGRIRVPMCQMETELGGFGTLLRGAPKYKLIETWATLPIHQKSHATKSIQIL